jgi:phage head maturation protease
MEILDLVRGKFETQAFRESIMKRTGLRGLNEHEAAVLNPIDCLNRHDRQIR